MINGLDIYYSKNIGRGLKPISNNNNKQTISTKGKGLKPISKEKDVFEEKDLKFYNKFNICY